MNPIQYISCEKSITVAMALYEQTFNVVVVLIDVWYSPLSVRPIQLTQLALTAHDKKLEVTMLHSR